MRASVGPSEYRPDVPPQPACPRGQQPMRIQRRWHPGPCSSDSSQMLATPLKWSLPAQASQPPSFPLAPTMNSSVSQHSSLRLLSWCFFFQPDFPEPYIPLDWPSLKYKSVPSGPKDITAHRKTLLTVPRWGP